MDRKPKIIITKGSLELGTAFWAETKYKGWHTSFLHNGKYALEGGGLNDEELLAKYWIVKIENQ